MWQSVSYVVRSTTRPQRGRKEDGLPRPCGARNDRGSLRLVLLLEIAYSVFPIA